MKAPGNGLLTKPNTKDTDDAGCHCFPITMLQESKVPAKTVRVLSDLFQFRDRA